MAVSSTVIKIEQNEIVYTNVNKANIKQEVDLCVKVEPEPYECVACTAHSVDIYDIYRTKTMACGVSLHDFLCKFMRVDRIDELNSYKFMCQNCYDLVNVLEQAELEYNKLKQTFEDILSKNPLFAIPTQSPVNLEILKTEIIEESVDVFEHRLDYDNHDVDSEDDPLSVVKGQSKPVIRVEETKTLDKRKSQETDTKESWECNVCGLYVATGGTVAESEHKLIQHSLEKFTMPDVKKDSTDGSQNNNRTETLNDSVSKTEIDIFYDDNNTEFHPDDQNYGTVDDERREIAIRRNVAESVRMNCEKSDVGKGKKVDLTVVHQCDKCNAKYLSLSQLSKHKLKHDEVATQEGESDWKCEKCNKSFKTKGGLLCHNKIHTRKRQYHVSDEINANKRSYYSCCVSECINTTLNSELAFFSLPVNIERRTVWLKLIQREDLHDKFSSHCRVCERHFTTDSILVSPNRKLLKKNTVPSLLLPRLSIENMKSNI